MLRKRPKERFAELKTPGDPEPEKGSPGSIEQQLDMCESGSLRGDEILHHHGQTEEVAPLPEIPPVDLLMNRFQMDLAEENREGDELSGDDHSGGLQGGERELTGQRHINTGMPGDLTNRSELQERMEWNLKEDYPEGISRQVSAKQAGIKKKGPNRKPARSRKAG
jgi:hypothetical protein